MTGRGLGSGPAVGVAAPPPAAVRVTALPPRVLRVHGERHVCCACPCPCHLQVSSESWRNWGSCSAPHFTLGAFTFLSLPPRSLPPPPFEGRRGWCWPWLGSRSAPSPGASRLEARSGGHCDPSLPCAVPRNRAGPGRCREGLPLYHRDAGEDELGEGRWGCGACGGRGRLWVSGLRPRRCRPGGEVKPACPFAGGCPEGPGGRDREDAHQRQVRLPRVACGSGLEAEE